MEKSIKFNGRLLLSFIIASIILVPTIRLKGLPGMRLEQFAVVIGFFCLIVKVITNKRVVLHKSLFPILIITFSFFIIISIINGALSGYNVIINDFFELYKIFVYCGLFIITSTLITKQNDKMFFLKIINTSIFVTSIVSITQYFNIFSLNELYIPYIAPTQYKTLINDYPWPRVIGLSDNPNVYAVIVLIGCLSSLGLYLYNKQKYNLLIMIINFIVLLMTRSRSGFLFFIVSSVVFFFLYYKDFIFNNKRNKLKKLFIMFSLLIGLLSIFILAFLILPKDLTWRIMEIFDLKNSNSWQLRLANWQENFGYFLQHPLLGIGPVKSIVYKNAADNEWLLLLKRYGLIGTLYFINMFAIPIIKYWREINKTIPGKIYLSLLVGAIFYMIPVAIFHSFQLMSLILVIGGITFANPESLYELKLKYKS
ncbi:O-antigen ligase-like membrane protein [Alkalibaculum bacchi]|uniref:O-antigen ligase-like membrane protein n=1 Tax=Alkalibaculum bacchi TaxID=645887 RepID=A0A366IDS0_9FIRM|nr:O-antigen ligase family protein [Alkalibaculum bacchi]RBP69088.1 O-antigen ligase-like membrane protein [Alkalibaculum bacchi]